MNHTSKYMFSYCWYITFIKFLQFGPADHLITVKNDWSEVTTYYGPGRDILRTSFLPLDKKPKGYCYELFPPSRCPLTFQFFHTTGRISWWIITIFGLWVVGRWGKRKTKPFFEIHISRVKNSKISNRNCAFLAKSVFSQYRVHFFMDHHDFWFVSC